MNTIAVLCSDLHLAHTAPVARSAEPDWYAAQKRVLVELIELHHKYACPIIFAGDFFDRWQSPPELINFAIENLPRGVIYSIPGQHDLPNHRLDEVHRSAYATLVAAGTLVDIRWGKELPGMVLFPYPWGEDVLGLNQVRADGRLKVAVIHDYCWIEGRSYPGAPINHELSGFNLSGYDVALFGDNHLHFSAKLPSGCVVWNNGAMMRRKADEMRYRPCVGLLQSDGQVLCHELAYEHDLFSVVESSRPAVRDEQIQAFVAGMKASDQEGLDFVEALRRRIELQMGPMTEGTKKILIEVLERCK